MVFGLKFKWAKKNKPIKKFGPSPTKSNSKPKSNRLSSNAIKAHNNTYKNREVLVRSEKIIPQRISCNFLGKSKNTPQTPFENQTRFSNQDENKEKKKRFKR